MNTTTLPRKKSAILAALSGIGSSRYYENHRWLFCFNVKCHGINLDFDHLVSRVTAMGYGDTVNPEDPFWLADARQRYAEHREHLFEWGIEDARRHFRSDLKSDQVQGDPWYADMLPWGDCYRMLPDGKPVDARFAFFGRSGGWLTLTMFDGVTLDSDAELESQDYHWLRRLLAFLTDLAPAVKNPEQSVEEGAAFSLFANICHDCETRESRTSAWLADQSAWLADQSGEH